MNQKVVVTHPLLDLELSLLQFIHDFGFCEVKHIMQRFSLRRTYCFEQIRILIRFGLLNYKIVLPHHPAVYFLTPKAVKLIHTDLPLMTYVPANNYSHSMEVIQVYLTLREKYPDSRWITERRLIKSKQENMAGTKEHLPDGLILLDSRRIAIEVELTLKTRERLRSILTDYSVDKSIQEVWYFCNPKIKKIVQEIAVDLPKIKIHTLNEVQL